MSTFMFSLLQLSRYDSTLGTRNSWEMLRLSSQNRWPGGIHTWHNIPTLARFICSVSYGI